MRGSRQFSKKIDFYLTETVPDGFGGNNIINVFLTSSWAEIKTVTVGSNYQSNLTQFGLSDTGNAVRIKMRKRNDLDYSSQDMFFIYRDKKYVIGTNPTNIDFRDAYIEFIGIRQVNSAFDTATAIFDAYFYRIYKDFGRITDQECCLKYITLIDQ